MKETIMIVVIILGVVTALILPYYLGLKEKERLTKKTNKCYTACFPYQMTNCYESNGNLYAVCADEKIVKINHKGEE